MPGTLDELVNLPEVSFIDNITIDELLESFIADFNDMNSQLEGKATVLSQTSPFRLLINATTSILYQILVKVDATGKRNTIKYSYSEFLDMLASFKKCVRKEAQKAYCTERFYLDESKEFAITIPQGTRVTQGSIFFETTEAAEIAAGDTYVDVTVYCTEPGENGNNIYAGEISTLVDPIPYIAKVDNQTATSGGSDKESDDSLADRTFMAPSTYSVAGSVDSYEANAKAFSEDVIDVKVDTPSAGTVDIRILLSGGEIPDTNVISKMQDYLSADDKRPLTDNVIVAAPDQVEYSIDVKYWIRKSDSNKAVKIQQDVETAVENFVTWQKSKIGRDITDSELIKLIMAAGAKRCVITSPAYKVIEDNQIAKLTTKNVVYGGLEND
ncbi:Phage-related baseplate assembly protein [Anaerosporobacter mobilis DSM 15930]|uniref:Phage-related baseplate assembly protein n=1 Tax=Anaerosporobacter mobilis DSM 15930 TaxID=1120996 RepID=A0A1M7LUN9_9FIRM|nr:baseplate J/gp47 family protein [Anaerosporobacter mobilis]SHM81939.1 Phage-related baseplate assembly protein [Anaerosporobacter mobilis DSM 15930]